jgi:hypothetical protein
MLFRIVYLASVMVVVLVATGISVARAGESKVTEPQLQWSRSMSPLNGLRESTTNQPSSVPSITSSVVGVSNPEKSGISESARQSHGSWSILMSDKTLYRTLRRWAQEANYQLIWQIDRDYPIEASVEFKNSFREALEQVMAGVSLTDYPLQAVVNSEARVLRVVRHQDDGRR